MELDKTHSIWLKKNLDNMYVGGEPGKENGLMELELKKRSQKHQSGGK